MGVCRPRVSNKDVKNVRADRPKVSNGKISGARAVQVPAGGGLMGEVGIKAQDFQSFLPKLESISQLILYKVNSSFSLHAIIFGSIHGISFF